jgi:hypothetical protein
VTSDLYVFGVDPGDSTGIAVLRGVNLFACYQGDPEHALAWLPQLVDLLRSEGHRVAGAVERFVTGGRATGYSAQPTAQRVVGAVETLCHERDVPLDFQSPAEAKRLAPNGLLRAAGLYVKPSQVGQRDANDVNDAVRHALLLTARRYASVFDRLLRSLP